MMTETGTIRVQPDVLRNELGAIVGPEHVRLATANDAVDGVQPQWVVEPGSADEVARVLRYANEARLHVTPRGGGTKLSWGNPPRRVDFILSTRRLDRVVEHAWGDMTATVEAGCTLARFEQELAEHGQRLALDPLWPERATIGGIASTNDSGPLRIRFGAQRDLIIGITVALPDGTLAKSGGKVVKNVAGYDLAKLLTGGFGTLGVITDVVFRLHPLPTAVRNVSFSLPTIAALNAFVLQILDSTLAPTGVQVRAGAVSPTVDVRLEGIPAAIDAQLQQLVQFAGNQPVEAPAEVWSTRESLWDGAEPAVVGKVSVLPTQIEQFCTSLQRVATPLRLTWQLMMQAVGVGLFRLDGPNEQALLAALGILRPEVEAQGGSLVILRCPLEVKARLDVWGSPGDALPLMRRVKEHFDPGDILNAGRYIGGI
jgi:glycolate oxidase FAD binding subunit